MDAVALPSPLKGELTLDNVSFSYSTQPDSASALSSKDNKNPTGANIKNGDVSLLGLEAKEGKEKTTPQLVLNGVSLTVPQGQRVAVVGPSGVGISRDILSYVSFKAPVKY